MIKSENTNGILASNKGVIDVLNTTQKRYVPPHERRLLQQQNQPSNSAAPLFPKSRPLTPSSSFLGSGSKWNENAGSQSNSRYNSRSSSAQSSPNTSQKLLNTGGLSGKWSSGASLAMQYGSDGLCPANKRIEEELFDGVSNTGLNFEKYENIEIQTMGENVPPPINSFEECNLGAVLDNNIKLSTFTNPTPVQRNAVPIVLEGRDLMACAQTGSGKTAAFLFPMISDMIRNMTGDGRRQQGGSGYSRGYKIFPTALILAPTRELAIQIHTEARKFTYRSHLRSVVVYGGADSKSQISDLDRGCHILVATPGRLIDMIERSKVCVSEIKFLCIDEADRMLDMGFEPQIRQIVAQSPPAGERQTLMFSATFPKTIQKLAEDFLYGYIFLKVGRVGSTTESITQRIRWVEDIEKKKALLEIIPTIQGLTLVFTETKRMADHLEEYLYSHGFSTASIHGDRTQSERELALDAFKTGQVQILVATDVASRGLDITAVKHVINYDLPHDIDDYVHRIGRTGRAGHDGFATAFFNEKNSNIASDLVVLLEESSQEVESWLLDIANRYSNRGTKPRRIGNSSFGSRFGSNSRSNSSGGFNKSNLSTSQKTTSTSSGYPGGDSGGNYSNGSKNWW